MMVRLKNHWNDLNVDVAQQQQKIESIMVNQMPLYIVFVACMSLIMTA